MTPSYAIMHRVESRNKSKSSIDCINLLNGNIETLSESFKQNLNNSSYLFIKNTLLPSQFNDNNKCDILIRIGGEAVTVGADIHNTCEMITFQPLCTGINSNYYHFDPYPIPISSTSSIFHRNIIFSVGGVSGTSWNDRVISSDIYGFDLYNEYNNGLHWKQLTIKRKLIKPRFGSSLMFITENKLLIIAGNVNKYGNNTNDTVELYEFNGSNMFISSDDDKAIVLSNTNTNHVYGGCCKGISYDSSKVCVGSNYSVEIYDCNKDKWILCGNRTNNMHIKSQLWVDENDKHIMYIASTQGVEWIDVRQGKKWNAVNSEILKKRRWDNKLFLV